MEFYELCRQTRDIYQSEPNREIELQILSQLQTAVFENGDKLPDDVTLHLNIKPILKNSGKIRYWRKVKSCIDFPNARIKKMYFFETIVVLDILGLVLEDLELPNWQVKHFTQHSAWEFSVQITLFKNFMKRKIDCSEMNVVTKEYWKSIL